MNIAVQPIVEIFRETDEKKQNTEYLNKVQRAIDQIAQGHGVIRDIIEVSESD